MRRLLWFRRDLRCDDNRLLSLGGNVLPIFIFDPNLLGPLDADDRRVDFIFEQVMALRTRLRERGLDLALFYGEPERVIESLLPLGVEEVCASGDYDAYALERDRRVSMLLPFRRLDDTYIFAPDELLKADGTPYLVFTPFYKRAKAALSSAHVHEYPMEKATLIDYDCSVLHCPGMDGARPLAIDSIGFAPKPHGVEPLDALMNRLETILPDYPHARDVPAADATSNLSVHLRFGTLGIRRLLRRLAQLRRNGIDTEPYFRELVFREFYAMLLWHFPFLADRNFRYPFSGIGDDGRFEAFCTARTGVPMVDAGITQLLRTGRMHNRVRMICASFFTKDLLLPWQWGEAFFARHLLDYDAASNTLSWQWSAGTGVDPQPWFRIFNPYAQAKRYDPGAAYVRRWLEPLRGVDAKHLLNEAWLCEHDLEGYPRPLVRHKAAAEAALARFRSMT